MPDCKKFVKITAPTTTNVVGIVEAAQQYEASHKAQQGLPHAMVLGRATIPRWASTAEAARTLWGLG